MKKASPKRTSLSRRFVLLYAVCGLIPLLLISSLFFRTTTDMSIADAKQLHEAELKQVAAYTESHMNDMSASVLRYVANSRFVSYMSVYRKYNSDADSVDAYLNFLKPLISAEFLSGNTTRHLKVYFKHADLLPGYNIFVHADEAIQQLEQYRRAIDAPVSTIAWYFDPLEKNIYASQAIQDVGADPYGVLAVYESINVLGSTFYAMDPEIASLFLVDEAGTVVISNRTLLSGTQIDPLLLPSHNSKGSTMIWDTECALSDGEDRDFYTVMSYQLGTNLPDWRIILCVPTGQMRSANEQVAAMSIYLSLGILVLSSVVILYAINHQMRRIKLLSNTMCAPGKELNTVDYTPGNKVDEFDEMIIAYNGLIERIRHLITENYETRLAKKEAELYALQSQINPHFIFNLLEQIRMRLLLSSDEDSARMVLLLSRLMRRSLNWQNSFVSMNEEVAFLQYYLELQSMRYNGRITYQIDVPQELMDTVLPRFTLQPLVENSFKHGFASLSDTGHIHLQIWQADEDVLISVSDDSSMKTSAAAQRVTEVLHSIPMQKEDCVGIANVHARLRLYYGPHYGLEKVCPLNEAEGTGWYILLRILRQRDGQPMQS